MPLAEKITVPASSIMHQKTGVIFIDFWNDKSKFRSIYDISFYDTLKKTLALYNIDYYCFHTGYLSLGYLDQTLIRSLQIVLLTIETNHADQQLKMQDQFRDILSLSSNGNETLHPELRTLAQHPNAFLIPSLQSLKQFIGHYNVNRWLVVGAHWGICTHKRELGFYNLLQLKTDRPETQIFSLPTGTLKWVDSERTTVDHCTVEDYEKDELNWCWNDTEMELLLKNEIKTY